MNYQDQIDMNTYLITIKVGGDIRVPIVANSDKQAYEIACLQYGADNVINDPQPKSDYGY